MGENGKHMPRRYGVGGDGQAYRTWGGKLPEEFGTKEQLLFAADNDLALYGRLTVDTLNAVRECGFRYEAGKLLPLQDLAEQGIKNKGKYPEVYRLSLGEASFRGELERYWDSAPLDSACRLSMDSAISLHSRDGVLPPGCLNHVLEEYGFDRVEWILANTIQQKWDDTHISQENKEWAESFHVPRNDPIGGSTWLECVMHSPVEAVEMAASLVREEHSRQREEKGVRRKPSILEQLAAGRIPAGDNGVEKKVAERHAR